MWKLIKSSTMKNCNWLIWWWTFTRDSWSDSFDKNNNHFEGIHSLSYQLKDDQWNRDLWGRGKLIDRVLKKDNSTREDNDSIPHQFSWPSFVSAFGHRARVVARTTKFGGNNNDHRTIIDLTEIHQQSTSVLFVWIILIPENGPFILIASGTTRT